MLWVLGRCSDQIAIRVAKRKILAHLLAFRLFADEPALMFRSQWQLLVWNARYLALMLRPTAVTLIPLALLLFHLDAVYGHRPLEASESAIVTAQLVDGTRLGLSSLSLAGSGIAVETPPLRFPTEQRVYWRVRAGTSGSATVRLNLPDMAVTKLVQSGPQFGYVSGRRVSSLLAWFCYPGESRLPDAALTSIAVDYPPAEISVFGFGVHWLVWFSVVTLVTMLVFPRRLLRVTF